MPSPLDLRLSATSCHRRQTDRRVTQTKRYGAPLSISFLNPDTRPPSRRSSKTGTDPRTGGEGTAPVTKRPDLGGWEFEGEVDPHLYPAGLISTVFVLSARVSPWKLHQSLPSSLPLYCTVVPFRTNTSTCVGWSLWGTDTLGGLGLCLSTSKRPPKGSGQRVCRENNPHPTYLRRRT